MDNADKIIEMARSRAAERPLNTYTVPEGLAQLTGIKSISLVELNAEEELMATKRAHNDAMRLGFELAKESLRAVDGKPCTSADGSGDRAWTALHPKIRNLVIQAYGDLHNPGDGDSVAFLKSRRVVVG